MHFNPPNVSCLGLLQIEIMLFQACCVSQLKGLRSACRERRALFSFYDKAAFFLTKTVENFPLSSLLQSRGQEKRKLIRTSYVQCFGPD